MLDAYFDRIGFQGSTHADFTTLAELQRLHLAAIPFEALDVLAGRPINLALDAIVDKLVTRRRGGYCFEQNKLFEYVLGSLGYDVRRALARVLWHRPADALPPPRSHLALIVRLGNQDWLVDVGFGGTVPDAPLCLGGEEPQQTRHDRYMLRNGKEGAQLCLLRDGAWTPAYELAPGHVEDADIETANWYTSTHPGSPFRTALAVALCTDEARHGLWQRQYTVRYVGGKTVERDLCEDELPQVLRADFGLPEHIPGFSDSAF
jgi:N-hydroxyarylamine O-acetyltransferase